MKKNKKTETSIEQFNPDFPRYEIKKSAAKKAKYYSVNTAFTVVFIAVAVVINLFFGILSNKVNLRADLTSEKVFTLSDTSKDLIGDLKNAGRKIELIIAADEETVKKSSSTSSGVSVTKYIYETCEGYEKAYGGISVAYVDPTYNPSYYKSRGINLDDGTDSSVTGSVIMAVYSPDTGRYKVIKSNAVKDLEYVGFERRLAAATLFVSKENLQTVGIITGHGENTVPYYELLLEDNGYIVEYLDLSTVDEIPSAYSMLVIVNPTRSYDTADIEKIDAFLSNGEQLGKHLMVFGDLDMNENSYLEKYLKDEWGLSIGSETVFDSSKDYVYAPQNANISFLTVNYAESTVSGSLASSNAPLRVQLGKTKTVTREFDELDNISTFPLLQSSATSFSKNITLYQENNIRNTVKETGDKEGPFDIAAVSEKYRYNGTLKTASDVVVCASTSLVDEIFLSNYYGSTQTSAEYMINLTKYLVASTEEIDADITSVDLSGNKLSFASGTDFILSFVSIVVILPVIFFAAGVVITLKRKHK